MAGPFERPGVDFQSGPAAVFQILDALRHNQDKDGPGLFVFPSSAAVYGDPLHWRCDCSRLRDLGYARTMDMDAGIAQYAHWRCETWRP